MSTPAQHLSPTELKKVLKTVMAVPLAWTVLMLVLAVLSCVDVSHLAGVGWAFGFSVGTTTVGVIALIWLPALLRLLVLTGGRVKAAGVEASAAGLLGSPEELIEGLTNIRTATEEAEQRTPGTDPTLKAVSEQVDLVAAQFVGTSVALPDQAVTRLAERYEEVRRSMEPGDERTVEMTRVTNEARVRASVDPERAARLGPLLIRSKSEGERIVGLAFLQEAPVKSAFEDVLMLIQDSATAFEMFHALLALKRMAHLLSPEERRKAIEVLKAETSDPRGIGVMQDPHLPALISEAIDVLEGE